MNRLATLLAASATVLSLSVQAGLASAADYFVAHVEIDVDRHPDITWGHLSNFCTVAPFLGTPSRCDNTLGGVGAVRIIGNGDQELLVANGPRFYTYEMIIGPMAEAHYHVTLTVIPVETYQSRIVATLIWDEDVIPEAERLRIRERYTGIIEGVIQDAKVAVEES